MEISFIRRSMTAMAGHAVVAAAVAHGRAAGKAVVAAAVDTSGDLVALLCGDGAFKASISIAQDKAYTAAVFGAPSHVLGADLSANPALHQGIALRPRVVLFAGGLPIVENGVVIGGIGVSGGSEDDDVACASAGLSALGLG